MSTFALAGNQNSGKTTLFNLLTGSNQRVGNWPGVTVEKKEGKVLKLDGAKIVDLPGVYSLSPYTYEEVITRNFIVEGGADVVINIIDATNLERNLYLTLQLAELGKPMVVALNMMDELDKKGDLLNVEALEQLLGIPMVAISAKSGFGVDKLVRRVADVLKRKTLPNVGDICTGNVHEAIHAISHLVEGKACALSYPPKYAASKLFEGDQPMRDALKLTRDELHVITEIVEIAEHKMDLESDAALADARYTYIENVTSQCFVRRDPEGTPTITNKIDDILTNRFLALPLFAAIMGCVFWLTFGPIGTFLADGFAGFIDTGITAASDALTNAGASEWAHGLLIDGVLAGVGAVLGFLPVILMLFLCLSLLEDSGYMARAAYVLDRLLRRTGLSGRSVIPMIMGFGCSVPAVMSSRTMQNERDRRLTIFITPFMSCGAKVPIYAMFVAAFFENYRALVFFGIYLVGVIAAILSATVLTKTSSFAGFASPFIMELPPYRLPTIRSVLLLLAEKGKGFVQRAFSIIFIGSMLIWFLQTFNFGLKMVDSADSMLASIGNSIAWIFAPLGFGNWQAATSVLTGFTAKEAVVGTLAVIYDVSEDTLSSALAQNFTVASALSFLIFNLLCMPCIAALSAIRRELGSWRWTFAAVGYQTGVAWIFSFVVYNIALLITAIL